MPPRKYDRAAQMAEANRIRTMSDRDLAANNRDIKDLLEDLRQFDEDCRYMGDNWDDLMQKYADLWVAVYRKKIISVALTQQELIERVSSEGHTPGKIAMKFLNTNPPVPIL